MDCPNCKAERAEGAVDCPACGIVFEKWSRRQAERDLQAFARREAGLPEAPAPPPLPASQAPKWRRGLTWAAGAFVLYLLVPVSCMRAVGLAQTHADSFTAPDLAGQKIRLSDCIGRPILLYVWRTDVERAQDDLDLMARLYAEYRDSHVCYISVTIDEDFNGRVRSFVGDRGLPYPVYNGYGYVTRMFWPRSLPMLWLIDRRGDVRDEFSPTRDDLSRIESGLRPLIHDGSPESKILLTEEPPPDLYDGPDAENALAADATRQLEAGAFDDLERQAAALRDAKARFAGGRWKLDLFYAGLARFGPGSSLGVPEEAWRSRLEQLQKWREARPQSVTARVALALATVGYAWKARGGEWAVAVPESAWAPFKGRLKTAVAILDEAEKLPTKDPMTAAVRMEAAMGLSLPREEYEELFKVAVASVPDYDAYYQQKAQYIDERWNGEPGEWEVFAEESAESTRATRGRSLYARIVLSKMNMYGRFGSDLFEQTSVRWPLLRQGLLDADERYPSRWTKNLLAWFACRAGDKETAKAAFAKIGDGYEKSLWRNPINYGTWRNWADTVTFRERLARLFGRRPARS